MSAPVDVLAVMCAEAVTDMTKRGKGLCGVAFRQVPYCGYRSDFTEITCEVRRLNRRDSVTRAGRRSPATRTLWRIDNQRVSADDVRAALARVGGDPMSRVSALTHNAPCRRSSDDVQTFPEWKKSLTDREARMLLEQFIAERAAENVCDEWLRDYYRSVA